MLVTYIPTVTVSGCPSRAKAFEIKKEELAMKNRKRKKVFFIRTVYGTGKNRIKDWETNIVPLTKA